MSLGPLLTRSQPAVGSPRGRAATPPPLPATQRWPPTWEGGVPRPPRLCLLSLVCVAKIIPLILAAQIMLGNVAFKVGLSPSFWSGPQAPQPGAATVQPCSFAVLTPKSETVVVNGSGAVHEGPALLSPNIGGPSAYWLWGDAQTPLGSGGTLCGLCPRAGAEPRRGPGSRWVQEAPFESSSLPGIGSRRLRRLRLLRSDHGAGGRVSRF